jgi:hypothetical protein
MYRADISRIVGLLRLYDPWSPMEIKMTEHLTSYPHTQILPEGSCFVQAVSRAQRQHNVLEVSQLILANQNYITSILFRILSQTQI